VALTLLLLVGSGLFASSLANLYRLELGLRTENLLMFSVAPDLNAYKPQQTIAFYDELRRSLAALPGVTSANVAKIAYFADSNAGSNITVEGAQPLPPGEDYHVFMNRIGPGFFATMGVPLLYGREFTEQDAATGPKVAIVNETFVNKFLGGQNPLGRRFAYGRGRVTPDIEIVGVVKNNTHATLREGPKTFVYEPYAQDSRLGTATLYVRTAQDPLLMAGAIRREVQRLDPNLPVFDLHTVEQQIETSLFPDRLMTLLSSSFGALAALLASIGIYGVMAYTVAQRTREIGIRMALGADAARVRGMILREVTRMALVGVGIGLPAAYALGRYVETLLFGLQARDAVIFTAATLLLFLVAAAAGYFPARRAARIEPSVALRYE
jgi:predicted permease